MSKNANKAAPVSAKRISIQLKLMGVLIPLLVIAVAVIVLVVYRSTSNIIAEDAQSLLKATSDSVIGEIKAWSAAVTTDLEAQAKTLESRDDWTRQSIMDYQEALYDPNGATTTGLYIGLSNKDYIDWAWTPDPGYDPTVRPWYQTGISASTFTYGSPSYDMNTKEIVVGCSRALHDVNGNVIGVASGDVTLNAISEIAAAVKFAQTGSVFIADQETGIVIGAADSTAVGSAVNELDASSVFAIASSWVMSGSEGLRLEKYNGQNTYFYLQKVPGTNWISVCYVPVYETMTGLTALTRTLIVIAIVAFIILSALIFLLVNKSVITPVKKLDHAAQRIADGDLNTKVDYKSNDEFGALADNFGKTADRLHSYVDYIDEIAKVLSEIAHGNLAFRLNLDYAGEFAKIKTALENISDSLNDTISKIDTSSQQVSAGAGSLSNGAQTLSQGAAQQAAAVEELSATISELSEQVHKNADDARGVSADVSATAEKVAQSNERMQELIRSMTDISTSSAEIDKVIKLIEDIAFQTNILALNAAVEAARAGEAGKGFAVVADEVRNLATKSQEAAKNTADLIKASGEAVQRGSAIANETAESLLATVEDIRGITGAVNGLSEASEKQAESISQVSEGINQIADVVQNNSATSEETAASSEELSAQAELLNELVENFQLKDKNAR